MKLRRILVILATCISPHFATAEKPINALHNLALNSATITPQEAKVLVAHMSADEHQVLDIMGKNFRTVVMLYICRVEPHIVWVDSGVQQNCITAMRSWQQAVQITQQLGVGGHPIQQAENGRQQILFFYRCGTGQIDRQTCDNVTRMQGNVNTMMHNTNMEIIRNMGNGCVVGRDPNCVP